MTTHHSLAPQSSLNLSPPANPGVKSPTPVLAGLAELSDHALLSQLSILVKKDRELTVELLLHLGEVEARRLHCAKGYSSLFMYCVRQLGFSEGVAFKRVGVARLGRRFPLALELLAQGELHLSALMLVGPHLTEENYRDWLTAACKKTKREVEQLVATRCPKPEVASSVRKLPDRNAALAAATLSPNATGDHPAATPAVVVEPAVTHLPTAATAESSEALISGADLRAHETEQPAVLVPATGGATHGTGASIGRDASARVVPLSANSYHVVFTAGETLKQKLDRARDLVCHSVAPGNLSALVERAIDLLILTEEKRRFAVRASSGRSIKGKQSSPQRFAATQRDPDLVAATALPEASAPGEPFATTAASPESQTQSLSNRKQERSRSLAAEFSRYVPAAVRRAVWERDGGQCTFLDDDGNRCTERSFLQIEHNTPHARGGPTTVGNCCLKCRSHNAYAADLAFGANFMKHAIARSKSAQGIRTKGTARGENS